MNVVYFQPKNMNPKYCERGTIFEHDPEYIWYLDEPCKILISEVNRLLTKMNEKLIKQLREGTIALKNDGTLEELEKVKNQLQTVHR